MSHLPLNIKKIRKLLGDTQQAFADKFSVTTDMQKSYEGGKASPDILYMGRLENVTGKSSKELIEKDISIDDLSQNIARISRAQRGEKGEKFHVKHELPDYRDDLISVLKEQNIGLRNEADSVDANLNELKDKILMIHAMCQTTQEFLAEFLEKQSKKRENISAKMGTRNGEHYRSMKEEGS
jgi:transcriptional regulator with XRE-family HTH domain